MSRRAERAPTLAKAGSRAAWLLVAAAVLATGCRRTEHLEQREAAATDAATAASIAPASSAATDAAPSPPPDAAADDDSAASDADPSFTTATPRSARSIGHTSVVLKVELTSGKKAAFKPASRRGPVRYKGEIAARRLALALGLRNVPPVLFRSFPAASLASAGNIDEMIVKDGTVKGALIPWIDGLSFLALESAPLSGQWKQWLRKGGAVPEDQRELARQISTLVAFDFLTGNWDRWSGGNVGIDKASGMLLYIDNDGAFFEVPPQEGLQKNEKLLRAVDKLSRGFVTRLRALDDEALARALGEESPGVPLLSHKALAGVSARRERLLQIVDAKLLDAGEATFAFP